jgi:O-antigen/teichoic acid export membrane protein
MAINLSNLLQNSLIYSLGGLAGTAVGVLLVPLYTRVFSPSQYGVIDLTTTVTTFLSIALMLGFDSAVGRYYADALDEQDRKLTASTGLFFLTSLAAVSLLPISLFSQQLAKLIFGDSAYGGLLLVAAAFTFFNVLLSSFQTLLKFRFQPIAFAAVSIGTLLLQVGLTLYLVVFCRAGIIGVYTARLVATAVFSVVGFWLTRSSYCVRFSFVRLRGLLAFGVPLIPLSISYYVMMYASRYFLKAFHGLHDVGVYGIGYNVASLIGLVVVGFQHAWGPFVYSTYKEERAKSSFSKAYDYASVAVSLAVVALSLFATEILAIFTTSEYAEAYKAIPFIAASIAAYTLGGYFSVGIGIAKRNIHRAWGGLLAASVNLGLSYALVPSLGIVGGGVATLTSFIVQGVILMSVSQRCYRVEYRFRRNVAMYFVTGLLVLLGYRLFRSNLTPINVLLKLTMLGGFAVVPFLLGLVSVSDLKAIRKALTRRSRTHKG